MRVRHVHDRKAKHPNTNGTPRKFTVELNEGEVDYLIGTTTNVGGDPVNSPRKYADRINRALREVSGYGTEETDSFNLGRGALFFENYPAYSPRQPNSVLKALYNHVHDYVIGYTSVGHHVVEHDDDVLFALAESGDAMARELRRRGETLAIGEVSL